MKTSVRVETRTDTATAAPRYDGMTIALHWATALLVLANFALAELWEFFPRPVRHEMIVLHISFGMILTAVVALRIAWRASAGRALPPAGLGPLDRVAKGLHRLLYVLVGAELLLGYVTRWTDNKPLSFFGLEIPSPFGTFSSATQHFVQEIHDINAWIIIALVAVHAVAALAHHYVLKDGVLRRMMPGR